MHDTATATALPVDTMPPGPESMVLITRGAASKVNEIRDAEAIETSLALRLRVVGGGCAGFSYDLYFDEPVEVDRQFEIQGVKVVVDEMSLMYLAPRSTTSRVCRAPASSSTTPT